MLKRFGRYGAGFQRVLHALASTTIEWQLRLQCRLPSLSGSGTAMHMVLHMGYKAARPSGHKHFLHSSSARSDSVGGEGGG